MTVPDSYYPSMVGDIPASDVDTEDSEIAAAVMGEAVSTIGNGKPASLKLILNFREDRAVWDGIPALGPIRCGNGPEILTTDDLRSAMQKHAAWRFLSHWGLVHDDVHGVWVERKRGPQLLGQEPPSLGLLLISQGVFQIVLAVSAPPDRLLKIVQVLPHDVDIGPIDDFLTRGDLTTLTANELHAGSDAP